LCTKEDCYMLYMLFLYDCFFLLFEVWCYFFLF
jgi:hypothetical protein